MNRLGVIVAALIPVASAHASDLVVPNGYDSTDGNGIFVGPLTSTPRTYQLLIHADELTSLVGAEISGISWRIPASAIADFPVTDGSYGSYDIYLSGSVDPSMRSLTFIDNVVGPQTMVRSGPLNIPAGSYTFGNSPNAFGPVITFNTPWTYTGGNLLVELRHTGSNMTSRSVDAVTASSGPGSGYGVFFSGAWASSYTAVTGSQGNFSIIRFQATGGVCRADLSGSSDPNDPAYGVPDGNLDSADFFYFLDQFVGGNVTVADLSGSSDPNDPGYGVPDGTLDAADFFYFLDQFVAGCP
ncbi:MAG: hypothetical protein KF866_03870 [Phycisphaeraceae bacterium]|nr:hypothetical protein [Phycisphaeraceae bacterium]